MKNKIVKLVLIGLAAMSFAVQIGCMDMSGDGTQECNPDLLNENKGGLVTTKYNGQEIAYKNIIQFDVGFSSVKIKDQAADRIDRAGFSTWTGEVFSVPQFPTDENQEKTYPIKNITMGADYYSISNVANGKSQSLVPFIGNFYTFQGWTDDSTAYLQGSDYPEDDFLLVVKDPTNAIFDVTYESNMAALNVITRDKISPAGNLQMNLETSETWNGTLAIKVLKNSNMKFEMQMTLSLTDGTNTLEQTSDLTYTATLAECHTHYSDPY